MSTDEKNDNENENQDQKSQVSGDYLDQLNKCMDYFTQSPERMQQATSLVSDLQKTLMDNMGMEGILENIMGNAKGGGDNVSGDDAKDLKEMFEDFRSEMRSSFDRFQQVQRRLVARVKRIEEVVCGPNPNSDSSTDKR